MIQKLTNLIFDIEEGNINPLDVYKDVKQEFENISALFNQINEFAKIEADSLSKQELQGLGFEMRNGRKLYNYEKYFRYRRLKERLKEEENRIKNLDDAEFKYGASSLIVKKNK